MGGINLYGFCINQPVNGIDINGELFWIPVIIIGLWLVEDANAPGPNDQPRPPRTDFIPPTPLDIVGVVIEDETGVEMPPFIPTRRNITACCGAIFTGEKGFKRLARFLGWDNTTKNRASKNLHDAKDSTGRRGANNIEMCSESGDILDPISKEVIGNLYD